MIRKQTFLSILFLKVILLKDIWFIMLISAVQQSDSLIHIIYKYIYIYTHTYSILFYVYSKILTVRAWPGCIWKRLLFLSFLEKLLLFFGNHLKGFITVILLCRVKIYTGMISHLIKHSTKIDLDIFFSINNLPKSQMFCHFLHTPHEGLHFLQIN